ncbi:hypothetical protein EYC80_001107 [Monilinia laxa]|uniref:SWI-SNF chromatin-remodeling complex protein n=1 Tax=Monilinia laxa TaxID=61186 RepID=A0A5N6K838_MONLA|nr:hypothetical protein EYC80_001107 [Monilinia laxa]
MARPYIPPSDQNGSLMSPMSSGSNTPISYRANVNRQKTKKWAEAKKIDYGGDDWGDDDDYDPYDAYGNEPKLAPASVSKPTGLRQQAQGLTGARGISQDRVQKSYGNLPSASAGSALNRRNSFEADDESRHFSNSTIRQESVAPAASPPQSADPPMSPPTRFSQMGVGGIRHTRDPSGPPTLHISTQQVSPPGLRKPSMSANPAPPEAPYTHDSMSLPTRTDTNDSSILSAGSVNTLSDYETSKDFSPSAVPAPLIMRAPPAPQSATNEVPATKFPARKSSLSTVGIEAQRIHQRSQETLAKPLPTNSGHSPSPGSAARPTVTPDQETSTPPAEDKATSPQLPDFHRISGFGADFFSRSKPDDGAAPPTETLTEQPEPAIPGDFQPPGDTSLRSQPSFGFRSVVNQAFETTSDNSVPPTPASKTGSEVKRSDSESTGTTGISPIMSRGPSTATVADNRNREMSTPAIMELVEPSSPASQNVEQENADEMLPPTFIPGHRRDISTPSPGNSPARTPDLNDASKRVSMGEHAWISSASPADAAEYESDHADEESARPPLTREASFRPQLPGGWQSYTTTAATSTAQLESVRSSSPQPSDGPVQDMAAVDLTPTTAEHSLPSSSLEAARVTLGVKPDSIPTPDPDGNVHSAMTPHPELIPNPGNASPEIQSRPDVAVESIPTESPPHLPTNDGSASNDEAIPENPPHPTVDLPHHTGDSTSSDEHLLPPSQPEGIPTSSTDTGPLDEENEKLRREIVRSLSPLPLESGLSNDNLRERRDSNDADQPRESAYLTDVYDDYWNDTADDEHSPPMAPMEQTIPADMPEIRPLSSHRISKQQARPPLPERFSWERSMESIDQTDIATPELPASHVEAPVENVENVENADVSHGELQQLDPEPYVEKEVWKEPVQGDEHLERDAALGTGSAVLEGATAATTSQTSHHESPPTFNVSLAQEKDQPQSALSPITPAHDNEQPAYGSTLDLSIDPLGSNPHSPASNPSPFPAREVSPLRRGSANSLRTSNLGKILTFKEIVAMKDVHERVHAFDETRERFAAMDSGLHEWISALKAEQPEHHDVTGSYGGFRSSAPTGSTRRNTKSGLGGLQLPYHQQYLNASATSQSSAPASSGIQQGFSPAHAKITTQQVQAKGKEFLHSAGMFGGKAGKAGFQAGKGLLAKGKNRLRAAGSSDKTSPPPKPRNPNRSSWSLALNLSKATGRTDPSRHAEQNIPFESANRSRMSIPSGVLTSAGMVDVPTSHREAQAAHVEDVNVLSREDAGEILASDGTEEQHLVKSPEHTNGHFANAEQTNQYLIDTESAINQPSVLAGQARSTRSNSADAAFYDAPEEQPGPKESVPASLVTQAEIMQPSISLESPTRPPISMMNRPRGASLDQVAPPGQPSQSAIRSIQAPLSIQSTNQRNVGLEEQGRQPPLKTLPPIRRTSKFGFEFGSRRPQTRFPISDDEDEDGSNGSRQDVIISNNQASSSEDSASQQNLHTEVPIADIARDLKLNAQSGPQPRFSVFPRISDPFGHNNQAQDPWRSKPAVKHTRHDSWNGVSDKSRSRRGSTSDQYFPTRRDSNAAPPLIPSLPFESPPSSAQRYPELFGGAAVDIRDDHKMSGRYYQARQGPSDAFIPRQQTDEPQGASPPQDSQEPTGHRRRRSSDLVNRGMNFVRSISRERRGSVSRERKGSISREQSGSVSRDEPISPIDTFATPPSRDDRRNVRGSGFWGNFDITGQQPFNSPIGRESMVAHYSGSQSDFMASPYDSPRTPGSVLNPNPTLEAPRSKILGRSTTTMGKGLQKDDKKSRLGGLSGIFSRSPKGDGSVLFKPKRATTDLSSFGPRSGTLSSPQYQPQVQQEVNIDHKRRPSQPLNFFSKFNPSTSLQKNENPRQDKKDRIR